MAPAARRRIDHDHEALPSSATDFLRLGGPAQAGPQPFHPRVGSGGRCFPQPRKLLYQSVDLVGGIKTARVRKDPHSRSAGQFRLRADRCPRLPEGGPVGSDAKNREPRDAEFSGHPSECHAARPKFLSVKFIGSSGRARDDVGDTQANVEEQVLLTWLKLAIGEAGPLQGRPEPVTWPGEVVARRSRVQARVDPGEQHPQPRRDQVRNRPPSSCRDVRLRRAGRGTRRGCYRHQACHSHQATTRMADNGLVITVDPESFEQMVAKALDSLPAEFADRMKNVAVLVEHGPGPRGLLGLYQGIPLTSRGVGYAGVLPDKITIYQQAICAICDTEAEVVEQVRRTVIHEVGHYFGISDERLRELGW